MITLSLSSTLFPYTTLFRSLLLARAVSCDDAGDYYYRGCPVRQHTFWRSDGDCGYQHRNLVCFRYRLFGCLRHRSEEHTSELQSREKLVCRLLLEKKKKILQIDLPKRYQYNHRISNKSTHHTMLIASNTASHLDHYDNYTLRNTIYSLCLHNLSSI